MSIEEEIKALEKRREMAAFQRKITTQFSTVIEYDQELAKIDTKLEELRRIQDTLKNKQ